MAEAPGPDGTPRRPVKEYEDYHFHDEEEVAPPPADDTQMHAPTATPAPRPRKLPPPPRRFYED